MSIRKSILLPNKNTLHHSPTQQIGELKTSKMVNFRQQMEADGISEKAANHITNARWAGTQARY